MGIKNKKLKVGDLVRIRQEGKGYIPADAILWRLHGVDRSRAIGIVIEVTPSRYAVGVSICKVVFNHLNDSVYDIAMNQLRLINRGK